MFPLSGGGTNPSLGLPWQAPTTSTITTSSWARTQRRTRGRTLMSGMRRAEMTRGKMCAAMIVMTHSPTCPASWSTERLAAPGHRTQRPVCNGHQVRIIGFNFVSIFLTLNVQDLPPRPPTPFHVFWTVAVLRQLKPRPSTTFSLRWEILALDLDYYWLFADHHLSLSIWKARRLLMLSIWCKKCLLHSLLEDCQFVNFVKMLYLFINISVAVICLWP